MMVMISVGLEIASVEALERNLMSCQTVFLPETDKSTVNSLVGSLYNAFLAFSPLRLDYRIVGVASSSSSWDDAGDWALERFQVEKATRSSGIVAIKVPMSSRRWGAEKAPRLSTGHSMKCVMNIFRCWPSLGEQPEEYSVEILGASM
jgi:hypothetical protein